MPSGPPPPRYRVVERGRRLEVIDTRGGGSPSDSRRDKAPRNQLLNPDDGMAKLFRTVALALSLGARDDDGRPLFTTADWFDAKGPRTVVLDDRGAQRLVTGLLISLAVLTGTWLAIGPFALGLPVLALAFASQHGRPLLARWFDGFERAP